jgi:hypothetical protein
MMNIEEKCYVINFPSELEMKEYQIKTQSKSDIP